MKIKVGDFVDFGEYGKLYILKIVGDKFWVTDEKMDRNDPNASGWYINKSFAQKVISESKITKRQLKEMIRKVIKEEQDNLNLTPEEIKQMGLSQNAVNDFQKFVVGKNFKSKFEAMSAYITHRAKLLGWDRT